jgi:hypothetical protein
MTYKVNNKTEINFLEENYRCSLKKITYSNQYLAIMLLYILLNPLNSSKYKPVDQLVV